MRDRVADGDQPVARLARPIDVNLDIQRCIKLRLTRLIVDFESGRDCLPVVSGWHRATPLPARVATCRSGYRADQDQALPVGALVLPELAPSFRGSSTPTHRRSPITGVLALDAPKKRGVRRRCLAGGSSGPRARLLPRLSLGGLPSCGSLGWAGSDAVRPPRQLHVRIPCGVPTSATSCRLKC